MKTLEDARLEAAYIQSINPRSPGKTFNDDPKCFASYCDMQANTMIALGMVTWAEVKDVRDARDISNRG